MTSRPSYRCLGESKFKSCGKKLCITDKLNMLEKNKVYHKSKLKQDN